MNSNSRKIFKYNFWLGLLLGVSLGALSVLFINKSRNVSEVAHVVEKASEVLDSRNGDMLNDKNKR